METGKLSLGRWILLFVSLSVATFMMVLDYSIANISIPYIAGDLAVSTDQGTYVITSFAVGNAIGLAMTGWLTKRIGDIRLMVISVALFTFFSWACGFSISLNMLVVNRFIQGLVAGPVIPLSQSLIIKNGTMATRTRDMTIWSMIVITAPVLGPLMGGYISYWYTWPWIFYINIPLGIFCCFAIWFLKKEDESPTEKVKSDIPGIILLTIFVSCLQIFLDKGQQWDWLNSNVIRVLIVGFTVSFIYLLIRELWDEAPFLKLRLFKVPSFTLSIICLAISYGIYFGTIVIVPLWLQEYMGYDAIWAGIAVSALGIGPICLSIFTPWLIKKLGNLITMICSFAIFGAACFYTAYFTTDVDVQHVAFSRFIFGIGFCIYITPLIAMCVQDIEMEELANATGIFHFIRAMFGGIGTSVFTTMFQRRTIFHHERVGSYMTPGNPFTPEKSSLHDLEVLNNLLDQQAAMLAINDAFFFMGWAFVIMVLFLASWRLIRGPRKPQTEMAHPVAPE